MLSPSPRLKTWKPPGESLVSVDIQRLKKMESDVCGDGSSKRPFLFKKNLACTSLFYSLLYLDLSLLSCATYIQGWSSLDLLTCMTIVWKHPHRHKQKCALPIFWTSLHSVKLTTKVNHMYLPVCGQPKLLHQVKGRFSQKLISHRRAILKLYEYMNHLGFYLDYMS
jgi:hypothetical protein